MAGISTVLQMLTMQFTTAGDADCFKGFKNHRKLTANFGELTANFLQTREKPINQ
jgi:hypothetical protein